ncbi:MAG: hypothetical protein HGB03_01730 [Candidatus Yonathbacteria bacterium]|nr:hypothetical protein [Candidatus Yonathbacteria bacterium]NTW47981.1 hypothetical protein [Candidatus Yonathbacteria bacterium]
MASAPRATGSSSSSPASRGSRKKTTQFLSTNTQRGLKENERDNVKKNMTPYVQSKEMKSLRQRRILVPIVPRKKKTPPQVSLKKKLSEKKTPARDVLTLRTSVPYTKTISPKKSVLQLSKQKKTDTKNVPLARKVLTRKKPTQPEKNPLLNRLERHESNPIILPREEHVWESWQTFNPGSVLIDGKVHLFYRAMGADGQSRVGHAVSLDGYTIDERSDVPVFEHATLQPFRMNPVAFASGGGWAGAEDPRVVYIPEDNHLYLTYTACDGGLKMAISSIHIDDVRKRRWNWSTPSIMSHPYEYHKNWMIFPEKIKGKYAILHSINTGILIEYVDSLVFPDEIYIPSKYRMEKRLGVWDTWVRGPAAPPIRTDEGWLVFYHAVTHDEPWKYKVGVMLLDLLDPTKVLHRSSGPVLEPTEEYEYNGAKGGIVYVSGVVVKDDTLFVYYGASDNYVCVASADFASFMNDLRKDATPKIEKKTVIKKKIRARKTM